MSSNNTKCLLKSCDLSFKPKEKKNTKNTKKKDTIEDKPLRKSHQRRKIKKTFAEAMIERIKKLREKLNLVKKKREKKNGKFFESEILNEKIFKVLKKHIQNEKIKLEKEMSFKNRTRLPRRRN
jgi:hypothetical protein